MNEEINYLKEHIYEIYKYKKSQKDLTYDMDLELLLRTCKALDFMQKENQQLKENYDRIYNENCKLREEHNITDISLLDENQQLKKQKDDVVEYINNNSLYEEEYDYDYEENPYLSRISDEQAKKDLLRMLGEIDG